MTEFTPFQSLFGGALIGLSAVLLMAFHGRVAGMTGILSGVIPPVPADWRWRAAFLAGAAVAPVLYLLAGGTIAFHVPVTTGALIFGGLLVGIGVPLMGTTTAGISTTAAAIGIAAAVGVILFFVGAVITHLRARDYSLARATVFLLLAVTTLFLGLAS